MKENPHRVEGDIEILEENKQRGEVKFFVGKKLALLFQDDEGSYLLTQEVYLKNNLSYNQYGKINI